MSRSRVFPDMYCKVDNLSIRDSRRKTGVLLQSPLLSSFPLGCDLTNSDTSQKQQRLIEIAK
jgi:hypothetical protein